MNLLNKKNDHKYFEFLKAALFQILFLLMCSSISHAGMGSEDYFSFWEALYIFGIIFSICVAIFLIFKVIVQLCIYFMRDKLKIRLWYLIVPILVLPYIYVVFRIVENIMSFVYFIFIMIPIMAFIIALSEYLKRKLKVISFVSKQKKVNPKVLIWILDVFLFFVSSVVSGSILCLLLFTWTSFANYIGF